MFKLFSTFFLVFGGATVFAQVQYDGCQVQTWTTSGTAKIDGENSYGKPIWSDALTLDFVKKQAWTVGYTQRVLRGKGFYSHGGTFSYLAMQYSEKECGEITTTTSCMKPIGKYYTANGERVDLWALKSDTGLWNLSVTLTGYCNHYTK